MSPSPPASPPRFALRRFAERVSSRAASAVSASSSRPREDEWPADGRARRLASALAPRLGLDSPEHARDVLTAMILCECVAKATEAEALQRVAELQREFPPGVCAVREARLSLARVAHRYLVAEGPGATYVAYVGTQDARDLLADAAYLQTPLEPTTSGTATGGGRARDRDDAGGGRKSPPRGPTMMVHRGFASRARASRAVVAALWRDASARGNRLVLCGHSLGGAVATVAALSLLLGRVGANAAPEESAAPVPGRTLRCVAFAAPPVGDENASRFARAEGWTAAFVNVCAPEDPVPRLLLAPGRREDEAEDKKPSEPDARVGGMAAFGRLAASAVRPAYAHVVPPLLLKSGGRVEWAGDRGGAIPGRDEEPGAAGEEINGGASSTGKTLAEAVAGVAEDGGEPAPVERPGVSASARLAKPFALPELAGVRRALVRHTMRAYRARALEACAAAIPDPRDRASPFNFRVSPTGESVSAGPRAFGTGGSARRSRRLASHFPALRALGPRPVAAAAFADGAGGLVALVEGDDLDLREKSRGGVVAECKGWPCAATVAGEEAGVRANRSRLLVRVSAPAFRGRALPSEEAGGATAAGWRPLVVSLAGDFGDARVHVRVLDAVSDVEGLRAAIEAIARREDGDEEGGEGTDRGFASRLFRRIRSRL